MARLWENGRLSDQGGFWLCLIAGLGLLVWSLGTYVSSHLALSAAQDWPTVPSTVIKSEVVTVAGRGSDWAPDVGYRYEVRGRDHRSAALKLNDHPNFHAFEDARAFLRDYPIGGTVVVHYDPGDPATSVLIVDGDYWPLLLGVAVGLLALAGAWYLRHAALGG